MNGSPGDELMERVLRDPDVPSNLHELDATLCDQPPREPKSRAENLGRLLQGQQSFSLVGHGHSRCLVVVTSDVRGGGGKVTSCARNAPPQRGF
jgi:hypothetical protein